MRSSRSRPSGMLANSRLTMTRLTPYDTGQRYEPKLWVDPSIGTEPDDDRYGKVDFNNDEDATVAIVWLETQADGRRVVQVELWDHDIEVVVDRV